MLKLVAAVASAFLLLSPIGASAQAPPPYGAEILRRDGRVLSVAGPFDLPFEPTTDDAA